MIGVSPSLCFASRQYLQWLSSQQDLDLVSRIYIYPQEMYPRLLRCVVDFLRLCINLIVLRSWILELRSFLTRDPVVLYKGNHLYRSNGYTETEHCNLTASIRARKILPPYNNRYHGILCPLRFHIPFRDRIPMRAGCRSVGQLYSWTMY